MFLKALSALLTMTNFVMLDCQWYPCPGSFDELRNSRFFVDNTQLIRDALSGPNHLLIRARKGFGKTIFFDMIRRFAEIEIFPNGTVNSDKRTYKNYKTFTDIVPSSGQFLTVFRNKSWFEAHFGAYPVIWLDLNQNTVKTHEVLSLTRQLLNGTVKTAFVHHAYLINSSLISVKDKNLLRRFIFPNDNEDLKKYSPSYGITLLKKALRQHFQKEVIVLVDNIDAPLRSVLFHPQQQTDVVFEELCVLGRIIEAIPETDTTLEVISHSLTIITSVIVPYHRSPHYSKETGIHLDGFSDAEMKPLAKRAHLELNADQILAWYGGFNAYNPDSVISFLSHPMKVFKPYWSELGSLYTFKAALAPECFGQKILECYGECRLWALGGGHISGMSEKILRKLKGLQKLVFPVQVSQCPHDAFPHFIGLLENLGYLTFSRQISHSSMSPLTFSAYKVPNQEVKQYLKKILYEAIVNQTPLNGIPTFRRELFEAISGVNGSEPTMRRFATTLVTLLVALNRGNQTTNGTLAHYIKVHLLNPPPEYNVSYVRTSRSEKEWKELKPQDSDLVFVMEKKTTKIGFVVKIELNIKLYPNRTLNDRYLDALSSKELQNFTHGTIIKIAAHLSCGVREESDEQICRLSYLFNDTQLYQEKWLDVRMHCVEEKAITRSKYL